MTKLTPLQYFFRYFSYSQAIVAAIMILGGLWLRLTTGLHAASFLFFVWGLSCVYMSVVCLFAWKNWFLEGRPDPVLEKKRRKSMMIYLVLGGVVWVFFGHAIGISAVEHKRITELEIIKNNQFDKELNRFVNALKEVDYNPVLEYTESKLVLGKPDNLAVVAFSLIEPYSVVRTKDSHIHQILIDGATYEIVLESHKFRFSWQNIDRKYAFGGGCRFHIPFRLKKMGGGDIHRRYMDDQKFEFVSHPELNRLETTLDHGELIVSEFLDNKDRWGIDYCRDAVMRYKSNKNSTFGISALKNAPIEMVRYLAFPGFYDGIVGVEFREGYGLVNDLSSYLKRVGIVSRAIFK